jgi:hypothetical protein
LFFHVIAVVHSPAYRQEHADALRQNWPRIPLPLSAAILSKSAKRGRGVASLLDPEMQIAGVTARVVYAELKTIGVVTPLAGNTIDPDKDLLIEAGWGHAGVNGVAMPGIGRATKRDYTHEELAAFGDGAERLGLTAEQVISQLGQLTFDVYLNGRVCWSNIPERVWEYTMGGYQVLKKWLSYREYKLLGRPITPEEANYFRDVARRVSALRISEPLLDINYRAVKASAFSWSTAGAYSQE